MAAMYRVNVELDVEAESWEDAHECVANTLIEGEETLREWQTLEEREPFARIDRWSIDLPVNRIDD